MSPELYDAAASLFDAVHVLAGIAALVGLAIAGAVLVLGAVEAGGSR